MEKVLEKKIKRYVLGAIEDDHCYYLRTNYTKVPGQFVANVQYEMTEDIEKAVKAEKRYIMQSVLDRYNANVGDDALEFVILPVVIEYSLIKEVD